MMLILSDLTTVFLAEVTASNLKEDKLYLSVKATTCTALNKQCQEIILVNKEGNSWTRHLFKWVDECLVEEVEDIKPVIRGMNDDISFLILNVARLGKEIEVIKMAHVRKRDECMRNVVVCGVGMAILCCYYYFFV
ncbi:hypothetical protein Bca52824_032574 [Brassica carinata]|uniref:Uncharacterized protein n=1 Tax=Brassica carinata TaxID=52824 RepID=A0A8X7SAH7_BRACI|nr:hypothetical protein Bca52824_032574 [Brassica carinata]